MGAGGTSGILRLPNTAAPFAPRRSEWKTPGRHKPLTSELQGGVLDTLLQAPHGLHQLLVELPYDLLQQASVLEPPPEGKRVICEGRTGSEECTEQPPQASDHRQEQRARGGGQRPWRQRSALCKDTSSRRPSGAPAPLPGPPCRPGSHTATHEKPACLAGPIPAMAVVQSPGSSQVSMVMVAGDPFTATQTEPR